LIIILLHTVINLFVKNKKNNIMNELQLFNHPQFGDIRVVEIEGKPYFVGNDVASVLGYVEPKNAISRHCKGALIQSLPDNQGFMQNTKIIPESDFYRLVLKSQLPDAEKVQDWVCEDILPSIRKHGGCSTTQEIEETLLTLIRLYNSLSS
jgi:prophage antirepressor-like protein